MVLVVGCWLLIVYVGYRSVFLLSVPTSAQNTAQREVVRGFFWSTKKDVKSLPFPVLNLFPPTSLSEYLQAQSTLGTILILSVHILQPNNAGTNSRPERNHALVTFSLVPRRLKLNFND
jgi:hypothetical protein